MAVRVSLKHRTSYKYERPASLGPQVIRLRPAPHNRTPIHSYSLQLQPEERFLNWQQDPYGNYLARMVVPEKTDRFEVLVNLVVDLEAYDPFDFFLEPSAEQWPFKYSEKDEENLESYLKKEELTPLLKAFVDDTDRTSRRTVDFLIELNQRVYDAVDYVIRMEPGVQTPEETLSLGSGSCRDSAWLLVQASRHLGLAARFVSGYLIQLVADEKSIDGPSGPAEDFTDLHAWVEIYAPGAGWVALDATSGLFAAEGHIPLACSPNPASASPIEGGVEKVETEFDFEMEVTRIIDVPRVTKPYTEEEWEGILSLGDEVDEVLNGQDLRLTMGGEPTFVSAMNPDAPEWNTAALGDEKLEIADRLTRRLAELWSPGALLHHGQGKWYPGEQLPRWAIGVVSRHDGEPVWRDPKWFARADQPDGYTQEDGERFLRELFDVLGLSTSGLMPAYEDAWYYMWKERRLPGNVDPLENHLGDELERKRLAKVFRQGLGETVGWVVPLGHNGAEFTTGHWHLREEHCFLYPGDSPIGYRLPLDSLPWFSKELLELNFPRDPMVRQEPFVVRQFREDGVKSAPSREALNLAEQVAEEARRSAAKLQEARERAGQEKLDPVVFDPTITRTALCAEVRGGILRLFMPPIKTAEGYLELCSAIERTCERTGLRVQLEGYAAPYDARLKEFKVTPDPGVLEINVPPTSSWREQVEQTDQLYLEARREKLTAEKFEVDGRHIGSGGGNHVVMGASHPTDSPFLRRPDLLRSLISFWHNHPALSFLFSGQFIGPTSQAPRIDEARDDSVYELEIAFEELARHPEPPPWMVDRVLRNILIDVTGNTHRTEFCIDKLYSPDSTTGRLGLLEMRAFEMPPHHRMASAQQLLVRALLATFAERPYEQELVKWGTALHDKFMLPHFVKRDLTDALSFLRLRGMAMEDSWFEPHYQFRFPYIGELEKDDVHLEVRTALEPWHVLGEEAGAGGQTRYVDSSVERVQVKLTGAVPERHWLTVNGVRVPLVSTGRNGESVAGIRYRAWQSPHALHPTIPTDGPLRLDIFDAWNQRSLAGCTYHIVHQGGRSAEDRPVNAVAAESRRIARFEQAGHRGDSYVPITPPTHPKAPLTLDLRRVRA